MSPFPAFLSQVLPGSLWLALLAFAGVLALVVGVLAFARHADDLAHDRTRPAAPGAVPAPTDAQRAALAALQRAAAGGAPPAWAPPSLPPANPSAGPSAAATPAAGLPPGIAAGAAPLPLAAAAPPTVAAAPAAAAPRPLLLVADDSAVARAKLRRLLEGAGYEVDLAEDGAQALEKVGTRPYALLITDLEMPVLDGFQLIAHVQGSLETEDLPVIAITGHDALSARVHDCQGLFGIFKKPWNDRELLKRVQAVASLRGAAAQRQAQAAEPAEA